MSDTTTRLLLPYILAAQAQKHVTHNEALRRLDGLINLTVADRTRTAPPANPTEGQAHLVAGGASGLWAGWSGDITVWTDGAWLRLPAQPGWRLWVIDESVILVRMGTNWSALNDAMGLVTRAANVALAQGAAGSTTGLGIIEATVSGLSGSAVTTSLVLPANALILGVTARVTTAIAGTTSFALGIAGDLPCASEYQYTHASTPSRSPTPALFCKARHHSSFARNQSTVRASPSSIVTDGRQPNSSRMRVGSIA